MLQYWLRWSVVSKLLRSNYFFLTVVEAWTTRSTFMPSTIIRVKRPWLRESVIFILLNVHTAPLSFKRLCLSIDLAARNLGQGSCILQCSRVNGKIHNLSKFWEKKTHFPSLCLLIYSFIHFTQPYTPLSLLLQVLCPMSTFPILSSLISPRKGQASQG